MLPNYDNDKVRLMPPLQSSLNTAPSDEAIIVNKTTGIYIRIKSSSVAQKRYRSGLLLTRERQFFDITELTEAEIAALYSDTQLVIDDEASE